MQKLLEDSLTFPIYAQICNWEDKTYFLTTKNYDYLTAEQLRQTPHIKKHALPIKGEYKSNMIIINSNFNYLHNTIVNLTDQLVNVNGKLQTTEQQLALCNEKLTELTSTIDRLNTTMSEKMVEQKTMMSDLSAKLTELKTSIAHILDFIPSFVRHTSRNFIKLLMGIKNNTVEQIQLEEQLAIDL